MIFKLYKYDKEEGQRKQFLYKNRNKIWKPRQSISEKRNPETYSKTSG